jgi:apolipoprotein N-acyltransferase
VAAGGLAGLALPPLGFPPLIWIGLAALWALAGDPPAAGAPEGRRWCGLLWGAAAVLVSHRWLLWLHPLDWIGVPGPLSLPLCLALWGACGLAGGLLVEGWLTLVRRGNAAQPATAVAAACVWGLAEVLRARGPLYWIGLGSSALPGDPALAGVAALGGAGLVAARMVYSHTANYWFLIWNLALAWVPFVFAGVAYTLASARRWLGNRASKLQLGPRLAKSGSKT